MGAMSRRKGAAGEREWCAVLRENGYPHAERTLDQPRAGGGDVPTPPIMWEVKRRKGSAVYIFHDQAATSVKQYPGCQFPAVALRGDNKPWLVILEAKDFFALLKRAQLEGLK